jgi:hypothetical protein
MSKQQPRKTSLIAGSKKASRSRPNAHPKPEVRKAQPGTPLVAVSHGFPTPQHPYYHLRLSFSLAGSEPYQVKRVRVNGQRIRDFESFHDFQFQKDQVLRPGGHTELFVRWDWKPREEESVEVTAAGGPKGDKPLTLKARVQAPPFGGYWDPAWRFYASLVLTELAGVDRRDEPVHANLAVYSDRIQDPKRELRVVAVDPVSGAHREVPCQVHEVKYYKAEGVKIGDEYQPTTTFQLAFCADVPADSSRVYLAFYGNPKAKAPAYHDGLVLNGQAPGYVIDNPYYTVQLHPKSGSIDEIRMKMGVGTRFYHHLETNGALHWNPCFYCPPKPWLHASDWDPPPEHSVLIGPVFISTQRSGHVEPYREESHMAVTYRFYARQPWIFLSTMLEVRKDVAAKALRNGEFVLDRKLVDEFAWRQPDGGVGTMVITDGPKHPRHAKVLPADTPWTCFFNRKGRYGLGVVTGKLADFRTDGGLAKYFNRYRYLQWSKWVYTCRPFVYTFSTMNQARLVPVTAGNLYYEEMALLPLAIRPEGESFEALELLYARMTNPLDVQVAEDTDPRAPEGWVSPVLVEEFEEFEEEE